MATLYELTQDFLTLLDMADDPEVDEQTLADTMEGLQGELHAKADGYATVRAELKARSELLKAEEARLAARRKQIDANVKRMELSLENAMRAANDTKFKTERFSFSIQKNPPSVKIGEKYEKNPDLIPMDYLIMQEPKIDKKKLMEELKAGKTFEFATLDQGEGLRIR